MNKEELIKKYIGELSDIHSYIKELEDEVDSLRTTIIEFNISSGTQARDLAPVNQNRIIEVVAIKDHKNKYFKKGDICQFEVIFETFIYPHSFLFSLLNKNFGYKCGTESLTHHFRFTAPTNVLKPDDEDIAYFEKLMTQSRNRRFLSS